jgi:hypothetical protein
LYRVYPELPIPPVDYRTQELDTDTLKKKAYKFIGNRVIDITSNNFDTFVSDNPGRAKILLVTDKTKTPIVYRALSTYFEKTLEFGMVKHTDAELVKKLKVKSYPSFLLFKGGEPKPIKYDGDTYTYQDLFDFINVYSETFVFGSDEGMPTESAATKAWLNEALPPMTSDSGNDVCFMKDGTLCVLYVMDSFGNFDEKIYNELMHLKENFTN